MRLTMLGVVALAACAHYEPMHFASDSKNFAALALDATVVAVAEDGRRSRPQTDDYEWWYLDGVAKDGTVVVAVFSDNWLPGSHSRRVTLDVTLPGKPTRSVLFDTQDLGQFAKDHADIRIGPNRFSGDLARYEVHVDAASTGGLGCDLTLTRRTPSWRPGTGHMASGDDFFAWLVAVPEGQLSGSVTLDGQTISFEGSGYHDHNWGNVPPWALMRNWWWGRGEVEGYTVVMSEMRPAPKRGEQALPLLFVGGPEGVLVSAYGSAVRFEEGPVMGNDDAQHPEQRAKSVLLTTPAMKARFEREGAPTTSADLLAGSSRFERWLANLAGKSPWYTRWRSRVTLTRDQGDLVGAGTLEFMDLE